MARLEDDAIMARFVRDYLGLLDERVATITAQLESGNDLTAHISLLSLESPVCSGGPSSASRSTSCRPW